MRRGRAAVKLADRYDIVLSAYVNALSFAPLAEQTRLQERPDWPGANDSAAVFLNQRGGRLSARGAHDVITSIASRGGLDDHVTAHVLAKDRVSKIMRALGARSRAEVVAHAASHGLIAE